METNFAASTSSHILLSHSLAFDLKQVWKFQKKFFFFTFVGGTSVSHKIELYIEYLVHYILAP